MNLKIKVNQNYAQLITATSFIAFLFLSNCCTDIKQVPQNPHSIPGVVAITASKPKTLAEKQKQLVKEIVADIMIAINEEQERRIRHNEVYPPLGSEVYYDYSNDDTFQPIGIDYYN